MSNVQFSLFGNVKISEILSEIQAIHKAFWYLRKDEEDKDYQVCRYSDGDILLCVYRKKQADKETREKILAKAVYLAKTKNGTYVVNHFNTAVLSGLVDCRSKNLLLECFVNRTELIDDLEA